MHSILMLLALLALALVLFVFAPTLVRAGRWYVYRDVISAQVQACGLSLQIGTFLIGWAPASWFMGRSARYSPSRLILFAPMDGGYRFLVQLLILGHGLSWASRQRPGSSSYAWPGPGVRAV